jgi:hypothetical protein
LSSGKASIVFDLKERPHTPTVPPLDTARVHAIIAAHFPAVMRGDDPVGWIVLVLDTDKNVVRGIRGTRGGVMIHVGGDVSDSAEVVARESEEDLARGATLFFERGQESTTHVFYPSGNGRWQVDRNGCPIALGDASGIEGIPASQVTSVSRYDFPAGQLAPRAISIITATITDMVPHK